MMRLLSLLLLLPALVSAHPCDRVEVLAQTKSGAASVLSLCTSAVVTDAIVLVDGKKTIVPLTVQPGPAAVTGLREYQGPLTFTLGTHQLTAYVVNLTGAQLYTVTVKRKGT